jgi:2-polyprenyl-3-methyl-5-hydroxy-6-metoxy-1,4-benzoquinol methylase
MADTGLTDPSALYFSQPRRDMAALVPSGRLRVLDVGCGFGGLGRVLIEERGCEVHGIERNPQAAGYLDELYASYVIGDVEFGAESFAARAFDCIIFADILEHLVDPQAVLRRYRELLVSNGTVVASIPNVRNITLLYNLVVRGRWTYGDSGLLDRTHLRFFTRADIHDLFDSAGFVIERVEVNRDHHPFLRRLLATIPILLIPDLAVCQFRVLARLRDCSDDGV